MQISQPVMRYQQPPASEAIQRDQISLIFQSNVELAFVESSSNPDVFKPQAGAAGLIVRGSVGSPAQEIYTYYDQNGRKAVFFGVVSTPAKASYQLWKIEDAAGNVAFIGDDDDAGDAIANGYDSQGRMLLAFDTNGRKYEYSYSTADIGGIKRLEKVEAFELVSSTWTSIGKVEYAYYTSLTAQKGNAGDLQMVKVTLPTSESGADVVRRTHYRYYTAWDSGTPHYGHPHFIKSILGSEGCRRFDFSDTDFDDADIVGASDGAISNHLDRYFEYEADDPANPTYLSRTYGRITKTYSNGECGCSGASPGAYTFSYTAKTGLLDWTNQEYEGDWLGKTKITQPDGTEVEQFYDVQMLPTVKVVTTNPGSGPQRWIYVTGRDTTNETGKAEIQYTPECVSSYNTGTHAVTIGSTGLRTHYTYHPNGPMEGFLADVKVQNGSAGDQVLVSTTEYEAREFEPVSGFTIRKPFVKGTWVYDTEQTTEARMGVTTPTGGRLTKQTYTFWSSTDTDPLYLAPKKIETEYPKVATANNGRGDGSGDPAVTSVSYLRKDGLVAVTQRPQYTDSNKVYDYMQYSGGLLRKRVVDMKTTESGDFTGDDLTVDFSSSGWNITTSSDALRQVTNMTYDAQGRLIETTQYAQSSTPKVSRMYYTRLADQRLVTLSIPRVYNSSGDKFQGPVSYSVANHNGRAEMSATLVLPSDDGTIVGMTSTDPSSWIDVNDSDPIEAVSLSSATLTNVTATVYDEPGAKALSSRTYFVTPANLSSTSNSDETTYAYDNMGRVVKTVDPTGTIDRTVFDGLGRTIARWTGTDDTSFTSSGGGGNMVKTSALEYDGNSDGKNSYLTKQTAFVLASTTDQRVTEFAHDYRGRVTYTKNPQLPHVVSAFDNRNRVTASATYSSETGLSASTNPSSTSTNRLSLSKSFYDERGRAWKSLNYEINQSTGAIKQDGSSNDLATRTLTWFGPAGNVLQTRGSELHKFAYDRLLRRTVAYTLATTDDAANSATGGSYASLFTASTETTKVDGDIIASQSQTGYDNERNLPRVQASIQRHYTDQTTTGPLDVNTDGSLLTYNLSSTPSDLKGRISISATWYDELNRPRTSADYGTYAAQTAASTNFSYTALSEPTSSSSDVLTSVREYDKAGRAFRSLDPRGLVSLSIYDDRGRVTASVDNSSTTTGADKNRTTRYVYANGLQIKVWADFDGDNNVDTDDQVTEYVYTSNYAASSPTSANSVIASNRLLTKVIYPDSAGAIDAVTFAYNAQGQQTYKKEQGSGSTDGNITLTTYDTAGRETKREFTVVTALGFDDWVKAITTTYTNRGQPLLLTQYSNTAATAVVNEVKYTYDDAGMLDKIEVDPDSAISGGSNLPAFSYDPDYELVGYPVSGGGDFNLRNSYRLKQTRYHESGVGVDYNYLSSGVNALDAALGRVSELKIQPANIVAAEYRYAGADWLIRQQLPIPDAFSTLDALTVPSGTPTYPTLDQFGRQLVSQWHRDPGTGYYPEYYKVSLTYDKSSNIESSDDSRWPAFDMDYSVDGLNRLTGSSRLNTGVATNQAESFTMDHLGNFSLLTFDANDDADATDAGDTTDVRSWNKANEILTRDFQSPATSPVERTPAYDEVGNLVRDDTLNSGNGHKYTYDVLGRLTQVRENTSTGTLIAEYRYDARNHRIMWRHPNRTARTGAGTTESPYVPTYLERWNHINYDDRWRIVEVYRDERALDGSGNPPTDKPTSSTHLKPYERYVWHNAGVDGGGGSMYLDSVVLRERNAVRVTEGTETLEERIHYLQNWRGDVVQTIRDDGIRLETVRYSSYGRPYLIHRADYDGNGLVNVSDLFANQDDWFAQQGNSGTYTSDVDADGDVDITDLYAYMDDFFAYNTITTGGRDVLSRGESDLELNGGGGGGGGGGNIIGYAGYLHDPDVEHLSLARNRFYRADLATWTRRDPIGYHDGLGLYAYVKGDPIDHTDPMGLYSMPGGGGGGGCNMEVGGGGCGSGQPHSSVAAQAYADRLPLAVVTDNQGQPPADACDVVKNAWNAEIDRLYRQVRASCTDACGNSTKIVFKCDGCGSAGTTDPGDDAIERWFDLAPICGSGTITICIDPAEMKITDPSQTLMHELTHALQTCAVYGYPKHWKWDRDGFRDYDNVICQELQAYCAEKRNAPWCGSGGRPKSPKHALALCQQVCASVEGEPGDGNPSKRYTACVARCQKIAMRCCNGKYKPQRGPLKNWKCR